MSRVEWSQGPAALTRLGSKQNSPRLAVGRRLRKQILDVVQRQAAVGEFGGSSLGHSIDALWLVGENCKRIEVARLASVSQPQPADLALLQTLALPARAPDRKHHDLLVLDAFWFAQPVHLDVLKLDRQQVAAQSQLGDGDDQDEDAAWFEPSVGMLEEESFKSVAGAIAVGGGVVGRVEERS